MEYFSEANVLELVQWDQENYWWSVVRNMWVDDMMGEARTRHKELRFVDVGCGTGVVLDHLCRKFQFDFVLGVDGDDRLLKAAREKSLSVQLMDFEKDFELPLKPNVWGCFDMLEHLADDADVVRKIRKHSEPKSLFIITVPAHPFLYSNFDMESGHYRRYTRSGLRRTLESNGWQVLKMHHFFSFLVPIAFTRRVLFKEKAQVARVSPWLNKVLTRVGVWERYGPRLPFGTSLLCLAEAV